MQVTCKKCNTTYLLDSDFVKGSGTKVRCSVCKHVFVVHTKERSRIRSRALDRPANKTAVGNKASNFNQVSFEVHDEESYRNLPGENPDIPCVPTLDADTDSSLYVFETDSQDERGRFEWEEFDFEPDEFDEEILAPDLAKVDTDIDATVDDRARQMALQIAEDYGWSHEQTELLAEVFKNHGWSFTRNRIINELKQGMKFYEFQFAVELRAIWQSHTEYSIGYVTYGSFGDNSLKYKSVYKNPDWSFCLKIIRRLDSIPDPEEMERHLDSLYNIWKSSPAIQRRYNTFYGFIHDAVDAGDNFLEMQAWQFLH